jgi:broad specificity phosphatase PhoE
MSLTAVIVRHGNTFAAGEAPRRIGLSIDIPLVDSGRAQARALGELFAWGAGFDRILAGPLVRTQETARLIAAAQRRAPAIETVDWLAEIDHGPDEGLTEDAVLARIGHAALAAWDEQAVPPDGWIVDADRRIAAWGELLHRATGRIAIVTSNGAARFALLAIPALQRQAARLSSMKLRTGAWGEIRRDQGALRLDAWDRRP